MYFLRSYKTLRPVTAFEVKMECVWKQKKLKFVTLKLTLHVFLHCICIIKHLLSVNTRL
jgi:hypothetical protein